MNEHQDWFEAHKEYEYMEEARELCEEAEAVDCSADELLSALQRTIQTNGKEIINRMIEIAKMDTADPNAGWEGVIFCRAAIATLSQQSSQARPPTVG